MAHMITMQKRGEVLVCTNNIGEDTLNSVPSGIDLNVTITQQSSWSRNDIYWGMLRFVLNYGPKWIKDLYLNERYLSDVLQLEFGHTHRVEMPRGGSMLLPKYNDLTLISTTKADDFIETICTGLYCWCHRDFMEEYIVWLNQKYGDSGR